MGRQRHTFSVELFRQLSKQQALNLLQRKANFFLRDLDFENVYGLTRLVCFFLLRLFGVLYFGHPIRAISRHVGRERHICSTAYTQHRDHDREGMIAQVLKTLIKTT